MSDRIGSQPVSYERAKELARSEDTAVRIALAAREDLSPEILYFLAKDNDAEVRRAVATNPAAPRQTDLLLARDRDDDVRGGLAAKIARVAPGLSADETNKIRAQTYEALDSLAHDQIAKVRAVLSEALKDAIDAPADLINLLARDLEIEVAGPILEFSPVLTEDDLLDIIDSGTAKGGLSAIARRDGVSESLADAIIDTDDIDGIADLLGNSSAQIREEALDDLISRSNDVELWQKPLVTRPRLPEGAAQRMAGFIVENLLGALKQRSDFDAETMQSVSGIIRHRLGDDTMMAKKALAAGFDFLKVEPPIDTVKRLNEAGKLTDKVVMKALQAGDHAFVFAALIVSAAVSVTLARKVFVEKNPQGIVALIGKSKMPVEMIVMAQQQMGRIAPSEIVHPGPDGEFPLTDEEIDWQIEFFNDMAERA